MLILGIDTSGKQGGIALWRDGALLDSAPIAGGTFSAQLIPQVAALLEKHKLNKSDLGGLAAASGPGSFTGLRVGLAAVKGLAEILGRPIATVSVLEAVALAAATEGKVIAALDAQRQEIFLGEYEVARGSARTLREELLTQAAFVAHLRGEAKPAAHVVTADASVAALLHDSGLAAASVARPGAADIARIGAAKIARGETVTVEQLDANYIRRSDAELFAKPAR
ncbi:MAG TPA: tRNA (adenosine(37)-N6)-threonylcarbamoyltransferase complex dimerization subunit type 1 TsaB [Terriglobales bacterium]|nr:tRNA (adenosine(37)-N6)-threonylcarbamoyltransferase complex dimerization subunit type 1 TsaB [Terriglobales bacterium]